MNLKTDRRDKLWAKLEAEIKRRAPDKDGRFRLSGIWKKFVRVDGGFKVYAVDGKWLRDNLSVIFGAGGHGFVHEFIPMNEIWVSTHHYNESKFDDCGCKISKKNQKVSKRYFDSTALHEITEFKEIKKGKSFWTAHQIAVRKEKEAGLLKKLGDDRL